MRNKQKQERQKRHEEFQKNLKMLHDQFDKDYPGWRNEEDAKYIKLRLNRLAKIQQQNKNKVKQKILKSEHFPPDEWPFTVDEVILVQTSKLWISIIVKNKGLKEYALNGLAETGKKLKLAHEAEIAIKGKSVGKFIQMGLEL